MNHPTPVRAKRLSVRFSKLWVAAEIFLFVLVGTSVQISYVTQAGLNKKEQLFCLVSELPKATVQAAIGGIPLSMGLSCGNTVLTMAVISILITAPLGASGMDALYEKCLVKDTE